jgi:lysozyme family protein
METLKYSSLDMFRIPLRNNTRIVKNDHDGYECLYIKMIKSQTEITWYSIGMMPLDSSTSAAPKHVDAGEVLQETTALHADNNTN